MNNGVYHYDFPSVMGGYDIPLTGADTEPNVVCGGAVVVHFSGGGLSNPVVIGLLVLTVISGFGLFIGFGTEGVVMPGKRRWLLGTISGFFFGLFLGFTLLGFGVVRLDSPAFDDPAHRRTARRSRRFAMGAAVAITGRGTDRRVAPAPGVCTADLGRATLGASDHLTPTSEG